MRPLLRPGTGHDSALWPVLLLLLIVLVPSAGVVWMMRAAMDNERLAIRQRLLDVYRTQLEFAKKRIDAQCKTLSQRLDAASGPPTPRAAVQTFSQLVASGEVDGAIVLDQNGQIAYPSSTVTRAEMDPAADPAWRAAQQLEFAQNDPRAAAAAYHEIAQTKSRPMLVAAAEQAEARCLLRAGDKDAAVAVLRTLRTRGSAADDQGRLFARDADLRLLELLPNSSAEWQEIAASLTARLNDYSDISIPTSQRRFLMRELTKLQPGSAFKTLAAEELTADVASATQEKAAKAWNMPAGEVRSASLNGVWQMRSASGRIVGLWRTASLQKKIAAILADQPFPRGVMVSAQSADERADRDDEVITLPLAPALAGWRLSLAPAGGQSIAAEANSRRASFMWTAAMLVAITSILALLVGNMLRRQRRLTRLKNDLVATVSHELKTPLASIRLLVDTLLENGDPASVNLGDGQKTRQYLEMIAQENTRLTRLIDNFLTFSRMERGKNRFDFQPADAADIVHHAAAALASRFDDEHAILKLDVERPLPIVGDFDALVTVVVNLIDNAWKYSNEPKRIEVCARCADGRIAIAVTDNGIGLAPRAMRRVFERFYQVDQRLSRLQSGCGLGLSIVKHIVEAHGGQVSAESRLGQGSTFTVFLPADDSDRGEREVTQLRPTHAQ